MLYALICEDAPGSLDARMNARPAHLARLEALRDEGRLISRPGAGRLLRQSRRCRVRVAG